MLDSIVDNVYWGGFTDEKLYARAAWLLGEHGSGTTGPTAEVNPATESNTQTVSALLQVWSHGAYGSPPWQTLGDDSSLDANDDVAGNTLLVPGTRFGLPVVGDMRLKALRDGEQIVEYLVILSDRYHLQRDQVAGAARQTAASLRGPRVQAHQQMTLRPRDSSALEDWQIAGLRRTLAELITRAR